MKIKTLKRRKKPGSHLGFASQLSHFTPKLGWIGCAILNGSQNVLLFKYETIETHASLSLSRIHESIKKLAYSEFVHKCQLYFLNYKLSNMYIRYQEKSLA